MGTVAKLKHDTVRGIAKCFDCPMMEEGTALETVIAEHIQANPTHSVNVIKAEQLVYGWVE